MIQKEPQRLYQRIASRLRERIETGAYPVDQRLPAERELAVEFDISRTVVREALIMLELEGRVAVRKGSGVYVRVIDSESVRPLPGPDAPDALSAGPFEMLQARQIIEPGVAETAALQMSKRDALTLDAICREGRLESRYQDSPWDRRFHVQIARATQNSVLAYTVEQIWAHRERNPLWQKLHERIDNRESLASWQQDHETILAALVQRDGLGARRAMWQHLENVRQMLFAATAVDDDNALDAYLFAVNDAAETAMHETHEPTRIDKR